MGFLMVFFHPLYLCTYILFCETPITVGSHPPTKPQQNQISTLQCAYTLRVWLSCWDRVMQCFIWHTSCNVMTSTAPIIPLRLVKPAVSSYLCFVKKTKSHECFDSCLAVTVNMWMLIFPEKNNLLSCFNREKHFWLDKSWEKLLRKWRTDKQ